MRDEELVWIRTADPEAPACNWCSVQPAGTPLMRALCGSCADLIVDTIAAVMAFVRLPDPDAVASVRRRAAIIHAAAFQADPARARVSPADLTTEVSGNVDVLLDALDAPPGASSNARLHEAIAALLLLRRH